MSINLAVICSHPARLFLADLQDRVGTPNRGRVGSSLMGKGWRRLVGCRMLCSNAPDLTIFTVIHLSTRQPNYLCPPPPRRRRPQTTVYRRISSPTRRRAVTLSDHLVTRLLLLPPPPPPPPSSSSSSISLFLTPPSPLFLPPPCTCTSIPFPVPLLCPFSPKLPHAPRLPSHPPALPHHPPSRENSTVAAAAVASTITPQRSAGQPPAQPPNPHPPPL